MNKKLYLAGPMAGFPEHNYPLFNQTAKALRDKGYSVINPAELNSRDGCVDLSWSACLKRDIAKLIQADAVALLPGWQESKGARLEHIIASALGMDIYFAEQLLAKVEA